MTRAGVIPLSDIAQIQIYTGIVKNTKSGMLGILKETGGTFVMNGPIFLRSLKPCCHLKVNGAVKCAPNYTAWGVSWNTPSDFCVERVANGDANYAECVHIIIGGKKIDPINCGADMKYACNRVAVGVKGGCFAYYATEDNLTPEQLRDRLYNEGWSDAIMMDGGGSACFLDKDGSGFAGDGRKIPIWFVVTTTAKDNEPEGGPPVVEVISYSLKSDGEKYLTKNFKVKEFACKDGSDPVFIARELPMVCQYIRTRTGKGFVPNSAYRTPEHNKREGGVPNSQHVYGCAVDIPKLSGYTPAKMASIAREIMPDWGGVGIYSWGIHVDVRKEKADWNG